MNNTEPPLPPHSIEAEKGILGCILLSPNEAMSFCQARIQPRDFYDLRHQRLYSTVANMATEGKPIDPITIKDELERLGDSMDDVGGAPYVLSLQDFVPSAANLPYYLSIVMEHTVRREMLQHGFFLREHARSEKSNAEVIDMLEKNLQAIKDLHYRESGKEFKSAKEVTGEYISWVEKRFKTKGSLSGICSGFRDLDAKTDGIQLGEMMLIAARPSIGKSAIALNILANASVKGDAPVPALFVSAEMGRVPLKRRLMADLSGIELWKTKSGNLSEADFKALNTAAVRCSKAPIQWHDEAIGGMTSAQVVQIIEHSVKSHGTKLVIVDYLQRFKATGKHEKRTYEVAEVAGKLVAAARKLNIALVCLAQLNRENELDKGRPPRLADLADSGQLERDSDTVLLLHRDRNVSVGPAELIIAKQRDGEVGKINLHFNGPFCRFSSAVFPPSPSIQLDPED